MIDNCYTFEELKEKFNWVCSVKEIDRQIAFARKRNVMIEAAFKKGKTYFRINYEDNNTEIWKRCPVAPYFEVNKEGKIRNTETKREIGHTKNASGYITVVDNQGKYYKVHRLIMQTFNPIDNDALYVVDHINGIKSDNRLENLQWMSGTENTLKAARDRECINNYVNQMIQKYGYEKTQDILYALSRL